MNHLRACVVVFGISLIISCSRKSEQPESVQTAKPASTRPYILPVDTDALSHGAEDKPAEARPARRAELLLRGRNREPVTVEFGNESK